MLDYAMDEFLPMKDSCALWTQGQLWKVFAFVNDLHVDKGDRLPHAVQALMLKEARERIHGSSSEYASLVLSYIEEICGMIGLGYPTTCAYQHVYHPEARKDSIQVYQYFLMPGLGCCCPLVDKIAHRFRADSFSHCTAACVVVIDGLVHWRADGCVYVAAWGNWQTSRKAKQATKSTQSPSKKRKPAGDEGDIAPHT
jgi:hypothetical protein